MKFPKATSLLLAFLILVSNAGFAFNAHFCGGNFAGITSVYETHTKTEKTARETKSFCAKEVKEDNGCCENKSIKVKEKSDHFFKTLTFQINPVIALQRWNPILFTKVLPTKTFTKTYTCDSHPPPRYKLYSQIILYA